MIKYLFDIQFPSAQSVLPPLYPSS